ncbi:MAG: HYR domain-containing protein [Blastocatellia bacterium]|nr:HYR domain-containing protein [Blastocatellia bacterium]
MGILHKRTHRPLAIVALLALFGLIGWRLPSLGDAVLAYSSQAVTAAREAMAPAQENGPAPKGAKEDASRIDRPAAPKKAAVTAKAADTPAQTALSNARTALNSAIDANRATPTKANAQVVDARLADFNTAAAVRVAEIKAILNATVNGVPANYDDLVAELKSLGGIGLLAPTPATTAEVEPNDTPATAQTLNLGAQNVTIVTGAVTPTGDDDVFKFSAPANSRVSVLVDTGGTLVAGFRDSFVSVLGTDGTTVLEEDDDDGVGNGGDGTQESGLASTIAGLPLTAAGDYYIRVRGFDDVDIVNPYKLFVIVTTVTPTAEVEANNDSTTANSIVTNASSVGVRSGSIGVAADIDFYSVEATAGNVLFISADGNPERDATNVDLIVQLRDTNGTTVLFSADSNFGGSATNPSSESFNYTVPATGTYFVTVRAFSTGTGTYNLTVAAANSDAVGGGSQVCPPLPITSSLGVAGGNFAKVSGTLTQRLNRDGVVSVCGTPRTQNAPIAATRTYDKYTFKNSAASTKCITIQLKVLEQTASNYQMGAFSVLNPTNLTSGWLGDSGLSSGIPPTMQSFSVNIAAGASFDVAVFNANATGDGNPYELTVIGFDTCAALPCVLTKPADITVSNGAGLCGANVTYPNPGTSGFCGTVTCVPASGSFFPKGTTTVTCTGTSPGNPNATTSFNVTVNDTQAPTIACPANVFVGTTGTTAVVNYAAPTVGDNCPGVQAPICTPPAGSAFAVGVTTVNCTVKDAVDNSASCSFQVTVNKETALKLTDPLACTGPGNVLKGSFALSNNGNVSQTVTATAAMPVDGNGRPLLVTLPGSCTASAGACAIVNATTISWTGTLAAGATATINYEVQVNDGVPNGVPMTVVTSASWNGGPILAVNTTVSANCTPIGVGNPYPAVSPISDQKAGSVLIYPVYTSSVGQNNQNSQISITNIHQNLNAYLHLYFVADNCAVSDAFVCLTPNQTTSFLASDLDPGTTGYLVAMAVDGVSGCPINFNYLIGDEYVKFSSGHAANLGAEAIAAVAGSANWSSAFCNPGAFATTVKFDGITYGQLPTTVAVDHLGSRADGNDTMLILNGLGGDLRTSPATLGSIFGVLYDDSEAAFSFSITAAACQFRTSLNNNSPRTTPRYEQVIPAGRTGWMRMWHRFGGPVIGATINFNTNAAASSSAFNQGHNLHKLTLTDTATITVPVFPPTC